MVAWHPSSASPAKAHPRSRPEKFANVQPDVYCYVPDDDPFDGEETAIWSHRYLFFNKERKRVCYFYIRGLSMLSHSPSARSRVIELSRKRGSPASANVSVSDLGGEKRARFWLGNRPEFEDDGWGDEDGPSETIEDPGDDEVDIDQALGASDVGSLHDTSDDESETHLDEGGSRSGVRHMSEHMTETMDNGTYTWFLSISSTSWLSPSATWMTSSIRPAPIWDSICWIL